MADNITISLDPKKVLIALGERKKATEQAVSRTVSDMRSRAPGAVASAVTAIYKIKKSEITPQSKNAEGKKKKVASIKVVGETIEDLALVYRGNRLTPTHFGMTPTAPTPGQKKGITVEIFKGQKRALQGKPEYSRPAFLASNGHGAYLPFQRKADGKLAAIRTLSVPQMIENEDRVSYQIEERLSELLSKRFNYHMSKIE